MIQYSKFVLDNGLRVVHHYDSATPMVALNILYNVGSRDENPERTGFAHLFEHLMFSGSINIPNYDEPLQKAGGTNNAWTSNDITNYYLTVPAVNAEVGFWLESDRMLGLAFSEEGLKVQKNVVVEEFKQRYLNQPYGDSGLLLYPMAYKKHPYQWPTIGKKAEHISDAHMDEVKEFFFKHYAPNNAILVISGNLTLEESKRLTEKWFGPIPHREVAERNLPIEAPQTKAEFMEVERKVPQDSIYKAWHMCDRNHPDYYTADLISDILSNGYSSRLYQRLVKDNPLFSDINAYISGSIDAGLLHITGRLLPDVSFEVAEEKLAEQLSLLQTEKVEAEELTKLCNKLEANTVYGNLSYLNKAMNLAYFENIGSIDLINTEIEKYREVTPEDIQRVSAEIFRNENSSTLYYKSK